MKILIGQAIIRTFREIDLKNKKRNFNLKEIASTERGLKDEGDN